jgi:hypothetical protein
VRNQGIGNKTKRSRGFRERRPGLALILLAGLLTGGCASAPPRNPDDLCAIFHEKPAWHEASVDAAERWGAPVSVPMAIMFQESGFQARARPPMRYLFGFIPLGRGSSAYGYSQAQSPAWDDYREQSGNGWADRNDFADAVDFVQWYIDKSHRLNGIARTDAYRLYLSYHEGWGGYRRGTYRDKQWLVATARKVEARAARYDRQYAGCRAELERGGWFDWFD